MDMDFSFLDEPPIKPEPEATVTVPDQGAPGPLFFDLETVPDTSREHLFGFDPIPEPIPETPMEHLQEPEVFLSTSLKEMGEIMRGRNPPDAWIESIRSAEAASKKPRKGVFDLLDSFRSSAVDVDAIKAERCKKMSVTPEFCRIAAIGFAAGDGEPQAILCRTFEEEKEGLLALWDAIANVRGPVCGYNIVGFDLPVILVRSSILGVTPRKFLGDCKPWDREKAVDLMVSRFPRSNAMKLKDLARYYGMEIPAGDTDGSMVAELMQTAPDKLIEYVKSDVVLTRNFYRMWRGYFC